MLLEEILGLVDTDIKQDGLDVLDITGSWSNELGSTMKIQWTEEPHEFTGKYHSTKGTDGKPHDGKILGYKYGNLIVFMVRWDSAAITAWVGQVPKRSINEEQKITTLWMMTSHSQGWTPINAGADTFTKV
ncbi:avidin/streptavidin family protein [Photorhabdus temperata]|uniref:avidin/streptavidin family protein n=1 Tax=Photorhabdus temperata TaxID=574560 RepID=UPI00038A54F1|nr:avidin/streptavidin family protein [Photorhabdus temperata]EQC00282.1 streptavidin [Photorhabdus temperata subsp. temperata M1021]